MDVMAAGSVTGNLSAIGYGLAAIGQPESAGLTRTYLFLGFAVVEALALLGIAFGFVFK
jgi:F-type H+-transporting ATPase subunit c